VCKLIKAGHVGLASAAFFILFTAPLGGAATATAAT
jgi:hypothetical protein